MNKTEIVEAFAAFDAVWPDGQPSPLRTAAELAQWRQLFAGFLPAEVGRVVVRLRDSGAHPRFRPDLPVVASALRAEAGRRLRTSTPAEVAGVVADAGTALAAIRQARAALARNAES